MIFIVLVVLLITKAQCELPPRTKTYSTLSSEVTLPNAATKESKRLQPTFRLKRGLYNRRNHHSVLKRQINFNSVFLSTEDDELRDDDTFTDGLALEADVNHIKIIIERDGDQLEVEYDNTPLVIGGEQPPDGIEVEYESVEKSEEETTTLRQTTEEETTTVRQTTEEETTTVRQTTEEETTTVRQTTEEEKNTVRQTTEEEPSTTAQGMAEVIDYGIVEVMSGSNSLQVDNYPGAGVLEENYTEGHKEQGYVEVTSGSDSLEEDNYSGGSVLDVNYTEGHEEQGYVEVTSGSDSLEEDNYSGTGVLEVNYTEGHEEQVNLEVLSGPHSLEEDKYSGASVLEVIYMEGHKEEGEEDSYSDAGVLEVNYMEGHEKEGYVEEGDGEDKDEVENIYEEHEESVIDLLVTTTKPMVYKFNHLIYAKFIYLRHVINFEEVFGVQTMKIGYKLRNNLINLFGFCMLQPYADIGKDLFLHLHKMKNAVEQNLIDVFQIIPIITKLYKKDINQQLSGILEAISTDVQNCNIRCSADYIKQKIKSKEINFNKIISHLSYNMITHDLWERTHPEGIEEFLETGEKIKHLKIKIYKKEIFSPVVVKVLREMRDGKLPFSDDIIGYLLVFFPWPTDDFMITKSVMEISLFLTMEDGYRSDCKILSKNANDMNEKPMVFLTWIFTRILDNDCFTDLHAPAKILMVYSLGNHGFKSQHRDFIELNAVGDLLDQVTFDRYPIEVILAKDRVKGYLQKISPFIDLRLFNVYLFDTNPGRLLAFLGFLSNQEYNFNDDIKTSIKLMEAYLFLNINDQRVDLNNMIFLSNAWISPDFMDDIQQSVTDVKYFLLNQKNKIRKAEIAMDKTCGDLIECISISKQLIRKSKIEVRFKFELPTCMLQRLMKMQHTAKHEVFDEFNFLDDITLTNFNVEVSKAAKGIKDYFELPGIILTDIQVDVKCTKLEMLLETLKVVLRNMNDLPKEVIDNLRILIAELEFKLSPITHKRILENLEIVYRNSEHYEIIQNSAVFFDVNGEEISKILTGINSNSCRDLIDCYNLMVDKINSYNFGYKIPYLTKPSPFLDQLNIKGNLTSMTVHTILEIVDAVGPTPSNELTACERYILKHKEEINEVISWNNCEGLSLQHCFQTIYDNLLYKRGEHVKLKLNILRYLLKPTHCTITTCEWINNEEKGSTTLNPLLAYLVTLLEDLANTIDSLHLQIDVYGIITFMKTNNINQIFEIFHIYDETDKELVTYLLYILQLGATTTQDIKISISNINNYLTHSNKPLRANVVLLKGLGLYLANTAQTPEVATELEYRVVDIGKHDREVLYLLKNVMPNCTEVKICAEELLKVFGRPKGKVDKMIYRLLSPDACTMAACPWLMKETKKAWNDEVDRLIHKLSEKGRFLQILDKLAIEEMLEDDLAFEFEHKPAIIPQQILLDDEIVNPVFMDTMDTIPETEEQEQQKQALETEATNSHTSSPDYIELFEHLQALADSLTEGYDHFTADSLQQLLEEFHRSSVEEFFKNKIEKGITLIQENTGEVNFILEKIFVHCKDFETCKRSLHDGLVDQGLEDNQVFGVIIDILRGRACPPPCLHKMDILQSRLYSLIEIVEEELENVHHPSISSLQFHMDIKILQEFFKSQDIQVVLQESYIHNLAKSKSFLSNALRGLIEDSEAPDNIKQSSKNALGLLYDGFAPKTIHVDHIDQILSMYYGLTVDDEVRRELMFKKEDIQDYRESVNVFLEQIIVNCVSLASCGDTLQRSLLVYRSDKVAELLISALKPTKCEMAKCIWLENSVYSNLERRKSEIEEEIDTWYANVKNYLLKTDFKQLKYVILSENLVENYISMNVEHKSPLLGILLTMDTTIKYRYDIVDSVNILTEFMTSNMQPGYVSYRQLRHICKRLQASTDYYPAIIAMEQAYDDLRHDMDHIKSKLKEIKVNCKTFSTCLRELMTGVEYLNDPASQMIKDALAPQTCPVSKCSWLQKTSYDGILKIIKSELESMVENATVPLIIKLKVLQIIAKLQILNLDRFLNDIPKSNVTVGFLKTLIKVSNTDQGIAKDVLNYIQSETVSTTINHKDLHLIFVEMIEISGDAMVKVHLENYQDTIFYFQSEVDAILRRCKIRCFTIKDCVANLNTCLKKSKKDFAPALLFGLNPETCSETPTSCPWLDDEDDEFQSYHEDKVHPHNLIIFPPKKYGSVPITLSLHDIKHIDEIIKLFPSTSVDNVDKRSTAIALHGKTSVRHILIDFSIPDIFKRLHAISSRRKPVINFKTFKNCIIALPMFHQEMRAFKFHLTTPGVKELLKQAAQKSWRTNSKPTVTLIDFTGSRYQLVIDIFDTQLMRTFLAASSYQVKTVRYGVAFWPKNFGEPWSCLADDVERGFIWNILDLYSIADAGDAPTSTPGTKFNINVFNTIFKKHMNSMAWGKPVCNLQTNKKYTFFIPSGGTRVTGVDVDLKNPIIQERLKHLSREKFKTDTEATAAIVRHADDEGVLLRLNFDLPSDFKTFLEYVKVDDQTVEIKTVGLISCTKGFIILLWDIPEVLDSVLELGRSSRSNRDKTKIIVPYSGHFVEVYLNLKDQIVLDYLVDLMYKTLKPFPPVKVSHNGRNTFVLAIMDGLKTIPIFIEESASFQHKLSWYHKKIHYRELWTFDINNHTFNVDKSDDDVAKLLKISADEPDYETTTNYKYYMHVHIDFIEDIPKINCLGDHNIQVYNYLGNSSLVYCTKSVYVFKRRQSIAAFSIPDNAGNLESVVLVLSDKSKQYLRTLSKNSDPESNKKVAVYAMDSLRQPETFILDMDVVGVEHLKKAAVCGLFPIEILHPRDSKTLLALTHQKTCEALILDLHQNDTLAKLKSLSDPKSKTYIPYHQDGQIIHVPIPYNDNKTIFEELKRLLHYSQPIIPPSSNHYKMMHLMINDENDNEHVIALDTSETVTELVLQDITKITALTEPRALVRCDSANYKIRLNLEDVYVQNRLKEVAQYVVYFPHPDDVVLVTIPDTLEVIPIYTNIETNRDELKKLHAPKTGNKSLYEVVIQERSHRKNNISLDLENNITLKTLRRLQTQVNHYSIIGYQTNFLLLTVPLGEATYSTCLNLSTQATIEDLIKENDPTNPKALLIPIKTNQGDEIILYLDPKKQSTTDVFLKHKDASCWGKINEGTTKNIVEVPLNTTTGDITIKCDANDPEILKQLFALPSVYIPKGNVIYFKGLTTNKRKALYFDGGNDQLVQSLKRICLPSESDVSIRSSPIANETKRNVVRTVKQKSPKFKVTKANSATKKVLSRTVPTKPGLKVMTGNRTIQKVISRTKAAKPSLKVKEIKSTTEKILSRRTSAKPNLKVTKTISTTEKLLSRTTPVPILVTNEQETKDISQPVQEMLLSEQMSEPMTFDTTTMVDIPKIFLDPVLVRKDHRNVLELHLMRNDEEIDTFRFNIDNEHVLFGLKDAARDSFGRGDDVPIGDDNFVRIDASNPTVLRMLKVIQQFYPEGHPNRKVTNQYSEEYMDDINSFTTTFRPAYDIPDEIYDGQMDSQTIAPKKTEDYEIFQKGEVLLPENDQIQNRNDQRVRKIKESTEHSKQVVVTKGIIQTIKEDYFDSFEYDLEPFLIDPPITPGEVTTEPPTTLPPIITGQIPNDKLRSISASIHSLILMHIQEEILSGVLVFDLNYEKVFRTFVDISRKVKLDEATHIFTLEHGSSYTLIKINTNDIDVLTALIDLSKLTSTNLEPTNFPKPNAKGHYFVFTLLDAKRELQFIVIDTGYSEAIDFLKRFRVAHGIKPLKVVLKTKPKQEYYFIDIGNPSTIKELIKLTSSTPMGKEVLRNVPLEHEVFNHLLKVPIQTGDGVVKEYIFDVSNPNILKQLEEDSKKIPYYRVPLAFYANKAGKTIVLRVDITQTPKAIPMVINHQLYPENVLIFFLGQNNQTQLIVLDKTNPNVTKTLLGHQNFNAEYSVFNIIHPDGYPMEIRLNLNNITTIKMIRSLEEYTPKPFSPFEIVSTFGNKKIAILCLEHEGGYVTVALNQNNNKVFGRVQEIFYSEAWDVNEIIKDHQEKLEDQIIIKDLVEISKIGIAPQDLPSYRPFDFLFFTLKDNHNDYLRISLDITEKLIIDKLVDMSSKEGNWKTFIYDQNQEKSIIIRLDLTNHDNIKDLKELSRYTAYPTRHKVFPPLGKKAYQVFSFPCTNVNYNMTINPNNKRVAIMLQHAFERYPPNTVPKIPYTDNEDKVIKVPLTKQELKILSKYSNIQINPLVVIPPNGRGALLGLMVPLTDDDMACITIDVNQERILSFLKGYSSNDTNGTRIVFYVGEFEQLELSLDLGNATIIDVLRNISSNSGIQIITRRNKYPLLKLCKESMECVILDLQNTKVKRHLLNLSLREGGTEVELRNEDGLVQPIHLPVINQTSFYLKSIEDYNFLDYKIKYPIPDYYITLQDDQPNDIPPIKIMHSQGRYPILLLDFRNAVFLGDTLRTGDLVVDLNQDEIMTNLTKRGTCKTICSLIQIEDIDGNVFSTKFDFGRTEDLEELQAFHHLAPFTFRSVDFGLPILIVKSRDNESLEIDLNTQEIITLLQEFSENEPSNSSYKLQIPHGDDYTIVFIDFNNSTLLDVIKTIHERSLDPDVYTIQETTKELTTFNFTDGYGDIWTIVCDLTDYFTRERLIQMSVDHKEFDPDYYTFSVADNVGSMHTISLNRFDAEILEFLTDTTFKTTGKAAHVIHKTPPKNIESIRYTDMFGQKFDYMLDMNNEIVLEYLQRLNEESRGVGVEIEDEKSGDVFIVNIENPFVRIDLEFMMDISLFDDAPAEGRK